MLVTLFLWIYIFLFLWTAGNFVLRTFDRIFRTGESSPAPADHAFLAGYVLLTTLLLYWNFFFRVNWEIFLVLNITLAFYGIMDREYLKLSFQSTLQAIRSRDRWITFLTAGIFLIVWLESSIYIPKNYDTALYHAQSIHWTENHPARYEIKIIAQNGEERWVDLTAGSMQFEGRPALVYTAFDITERDKAEHKILAVLHGVHGANV